MIQIKSHRGVYSVQRLSPDSIRSAQEPDDLNNLHILIDSKVRKLHSNLLAPFFTNAKSVLEIQAVEDQKDFRSIAPIMEQLLDSGLRRNHRLLAIGGGITQDIVCFIASVLFRSVRWDFMPTTLLAQADSCIGSKSSINFGRHKNLIGTFYPPQKIWFCSSFLDSLTQDEVLSGIGEILKVHVLDGSQSFDRIAHQHKRLICYKENSDLRALLESSILDSLQIKRSFIEKDEFDKDHRNLLNYGHSFGHAIETATCFEVPHGIAVTMGMDMANWISLCRARITKAAFDRLHAVMSENLGRHARPRLNVEDFFASIAKDKKNTSQALQLILLKSQSLNADSEWVAEKVAVTLDDRFRSECMKYFAGIPNE